MKRTSGGPPNRRIPLPVFPWWVRWGAVAVVAGVIFYWSVPTAPPPEPTGPTPTEATEGTPDLLPLATWRHFVAYAILGLTLAYALVTHHSRRVKKAVLVFTVAFLYGVVMELTQVRVPGRTPSSVDVLVNGVGVLAGLTWYLLEPRFRTIRMTGNRISAFIEWITDR